MDPSKWPRCPPTGKTRRATDADRLAAEERHSDAIAMYELNAEYFPDSVTIWLELGQLFERADAGSGLATRS